MTSVKSMDFGRLAAARKADSPMLAGHSPGRPRRLKRLATLQAQGFKCKPTSIEGRTAAWSAIWGPASPIMSSGMLAAVISQRGGPSIVGRAWRDWGARANPATAIRYQTIEDAIKDPARSHLKVAPRLVRQPGCNTVPSLSPKRKAGHAPPKKWSGVCITSARKRASDLWG